MADETIENGKLVTLHYTGTLEDGQVFDTSEGKDPLSFVVGEKKMIPGFEKNILGMQVGEEKEFTLQPEEAYGQYNEQLKQKVPRANIPQDIEVKIGTMLALKDPQGRMFPAKVIEIAGEEVVLDLNHMLAGKTLTFKVKIVSIADAAA